MKTNKDKSGSNYESDKSSEVYKKIMVLHKKAIENNEDTYIDPETGYEVFTAKFLLDREYCCDCGCRHCPY